MSAGGRQDRASLLTPAGRGAVAVVSAEGPAAMAAVDAHFYAANGRPFHKQAINRVVFGHWRSGEHAEEVIVCRHSAERLEVHCHGGAPAAQRILDELAERGCSVISWRDWLRETAECPLIAEAESALAAASTRRTAAILLDQRNGALERAMEAARSEIAARNVDAARRRLTGLLERGPLGMHLNRPWHVAIAGAPNVGKSSLMNAVVGYQRAIVFDQPGTTRDVLTAETAIEGWPVRLTDAAGIRAATEPLEAEGVSRARQQLAEAELVLWILDASTLSPEELADPRQLAERACAAELAGRELGAPLLVAVSKIDLVDGLPDRLSILGPAKNGSALFVSALTGTGLEDLLAAIARRLVPSPPAIGAPVPFTQRQTDVIAQAIADLQRGDAPAAIATLDRLLAPGRGKRTAW